MDERSPNFDLMRLVAAYLVLWSHQHPIGGLPEPAIPFIGSVGGLGVYIFFAISGYLNARSLFRSKSAASFLISRAFRIFPALAVCAVVCVVMGAWVSTVALSDYLWPSGSSLADRHTPFSFLWRNSLLLLGLDYTLPGVFGDHPIPRIVNGSLWTLPYEVKFYIYLALAGLCVRYNAAVFGVVALAMIIAAAIAGFVMPLGPLWIGKYGIAFGIIFITGVLLALLEIRVGRLRAVLLVSILPAALLLRSEFETAILAGIAPVCVALAAIPLPDWMRPRIDISYGVYLYAFPVQQLTFNMAGSFPLGLLLAAALTTLCGCLSAVLVERPMLKWRKRLGGQRAGAAAQSPESENRPVMPAGSY